MTMVSAAAYCVLLTRLVAAVERGALTWDEADRRMRTVWIR